MAPEVCVWGGVGHLVPLFARGAESARSREDTPPQTGNKMYLFLFLIFYSRYVPPVPLTNGYVCLCSFISRLYYCFVDNSRWRTANSLKPKCYLNQLFRFILIWSATTALRGGLVRDRGTGL